MLAGKQWAVAEKKTEKWGRGGKGSSTERSKTSKNKNYLYRWDKIFIKKFSLTKNKNKKKSQTLSAEWFECYYFLNLRIFWDYTLIMSYMRLFRITLGMENDINGFHNMGITVFGFLGKRGQFK